MRKKGFTLIELLSVIVVLAIIAVIAIPTLIGVVNKARLQSLKNSAYGLIEASNLYYAQYSNPNNVRFDIKNNVVSTTETNKLKYKGNVKDGVVIISKNGKVTVCITDGKNSAYKNYNESEVTLVSKKTCTVPANTSVVYLDGEATIDAVDAKNILDRLDLMDQKIDELKNNNVNIKCAMYGTVTSTTSNGVITVDISSLNLKSANDYMVLITPSHASASVSNGAIVSKTSTSFGIKSYNTDVIYSYQVITFR